MSKIMQNKNHELFLQMQRESSFSASLGITRDQAQSILQSVFIHPVVGNSVEKKYDPTGEIGFCFGRAVYIHLELLRRGVDAKSIAKVFAIGGLTRDYAFWNFHVTTVVKSTTGQWLAIDGLQREVLPLEDWASEILKWDRDPLYPTMRFYFTEASKFRPLPGAYSTESFSNPLYNGYFKDLLQWFGKHPGQ